MRLCPQCDYDLTGLPDEHTCPECGFVYDTHATSIKLTARKEFRNGLIFGSVYLVWFVLFRSSSTFRMPVWFLIGIVILFLTVTLFRLRKYQTVASRMILTRHGISFFSPSGMTQPIPWAEIRSASCNWWDGQLRLTRPDQIEPMDISHRALGGVRIGKKCAAEINRLKSIYQSETPQPHPQAIALNADFPSAAG